MQCQTGNLGAGTGYSMNYYKNAGRFDKTPKIGDQIFFRYSGDSGCDHTGLVVDVSGTEITTIEGNSDNQVRKRTYSRDYSAILGYGHPWYDAYDDPQPLMACLVIMTQLEKGSTGTEVKTLQRLLKSYGYKDQSGNVLAIDGDFGAMTKYALIAYQIGHKLTGDGICGEKTWSKLLKG